MAVCEAVGPGGRAPATVSASNDWKWRQLRSDVELVQAVLAGDRAQFAALVERYQRDIFNLAYRSTHHRQDAEDITQETFLRAFRSLPSYDVSRPLRTWLYAIAVNVCRDWARRRTSRPQTLTLLDTDGPVEGAGVVSGAAAIGHDGGSRADGADANAAAQPEQLFLRREAQQLVESAVMALEPDYRLPVVLFYMRGVPQADIAEMMGVSLSVVKNRLFRARQRLRAVLSDVLGEAVIDA